MRASLSTKADAVEVRLELRSNKAARLAWFASRVLAVHATALLRHLLKEPFRSIYPRSNVHRDRYGWLTLNPCLEMEQTKELFRRVIHNRPASRLHSRDEFAFDSSYGIRQIPNSLQIRINYGNILICALATSNAPCRVFT
jgi:hypothetical protein